MTRSGIIAVALGGVLAGGALTLVATRGGAGTSVKEATGTARYRCPMHTTYTSDKPGDCPICKMKLVPIEDDRAGRSRGKPGERKIAFYRSPMDPSVQADKPSKDAMGMDFVPVYEDEPRGSLRASRAGRWSRSPRSGGSFWACAAKRSGRSGSRTASGPSAGWWSTSAGCATFTPGSTGTSSTSTSTTPASSSAAGNGCCPSTAPSWWRPSRSTCWPTAPRRDWPRAPCAPRPRAAWTSSRPLGSGCS